MQILTEAAGSVRATEAVRRRAGVYAIRNLFDAAPQIREFAVSAKITALVESAMGSDAIAVRGTLFDKNPGANWLVPWHQDLTICVKERIEMDGFGPWTVKAGVHHVQPPVSILEAMVAIRIHLDDCGGDNGALRVLPGTHRLGRLDPGQIERERASGCAVTCAVARGGAMLMKPLLLHGSPAARNPSHRRVLHLEFAAVDLPAGLRWVGH